MPLYHLVYVSIADHPFRPEELLRLLERSRENNLRDEITGMLLYKDAKFMQLLEGPERAVCATYARIAKDRRHREITVLLEGPRPAISKNGPWASMISMRRARRPNPGSRSS